MKQLLQSLSNGDTSVIDVPAPIATSGQLLIRTSTSLISAGTERMLVEFGKGNLVQKARQQPEKLKLVIQKARTDGILETLNAVRSKLDQPLALGYCNVGRVIDSKVHGFSNGDRVATNGKHAEIVAVPKHLCARIPDGVSDEAASFTVLAAIGLQGVRLANPTLGECVVVIGLGLIGLLTVQLLRAQGCRVLGIDLNSERIDLARQFGAEVANPSAGEDVLSRALAFSRGVGVDAVIVTATTQNSEPIAQAAKMCRKRGRIVLVGVVGLKLNRADFYEKELSFQVSCSYGPGRYDPTYEQDGQDYPIGFVRWTEQRNFEAVLDLMESGALNVEPLVTHQFPIERADEAVALLGSAQSSLGILLRYSHDDDQRPPSRRIELEYTSKSGMGAVGFLGAGNYAARVLIPAFRTAGGKLHTIVSAGGLSASYVGRKFGFAIAASEESAVLESLEVDTVVIATRHNSHARYVLAALRAGKHVFCEKPLCLTMEELAAIEDEALSRPAQHLMVGFNRRFSPQAMKLKSLLSVITQPKCVVINVNAGEVERDHWTQDKNIGGGRLIGEVCHFIDLARFIIGSPIVRHCVTAVGIHPEIAVRDDKVILTLECEDGSIAAIHYFANGNREFPKERVEVFTSGRVLQLDNFRKLRGWGWPGFRSYNLWRQDKGQLQCVRSFLQSITTQESAPIPLAEIIEVSRVAILASEQIRSANAS